MDPHLLRTFVTVLDRGSFSAAAEALGYTQSAVSQHIATLESDLGAVLLHRRPVAPTIAGERLLDHAEPILRRLDAARADIQRTVGEPGGHVLFGATPLAVGERTARVLAELRRSWPGLEITIRVESRADVVAGVATSEHHVGLVDGVVAASDPLRLSEVDFLSVVPIGEEPIDVVLPLGHPLANRSALRLADLVDAVWIDAPMVAGPLADLCAVTETVRLRSTIRYLGTDTAMLITLVAAGHGLTLLPARVARVAPAVRAMPLAAPRLVHRIELLCGRHTQPVVAALAAALTSASPVKNECATISRYVELVRLLDVTVRPFERIVAEHGSTVLRVCRAVLGGADAEDAWSETFLAALKAYPELPADANVQAWLVTIAHRKAIDITRARARRAVPVGEVPDRPTKYGQPDESDADLWSAVAALPTKQRTVLAYRYLGGLSYQDITEIVGGSADAARRAAADGMRTLRATYPQAASMEGGEQS